MGVKMEESRREAPLYGQVESRKMLQAGDHTPEDAEFYVVVQGSRLTHVTTANRGSDGRTLCFTVPGHDRAEVVAVTSYFHTEDQIVSCGIEESLEYIRDVAQEAAEYLSVNSDQFGPKSYLEVLKRFSTCIQETDDELSGGHFDGDEDEQLRLKARDKTGLRHLDEKITQAVANMDYPQQWKTTDNQSREAADHQPKETLLHLAVRLGLVHLSRFLIHQPKGQRDLTLTNQEGNTPLQLALKYGELGIFRLLATPPGLTAGPVPCVWSNTSHMLRFCPGTDSLTLTLQQAPGGNPQDSITVLRDKLRDISIVKLITMLRADTEVLKGDDENILLDEGLSMELSGEEHTLLDNVLEEQLVLSLDEDEEEHSSSTVNGRFMSSSINQNHVTHRPGLCSMIHSDDQTVPQQAQVDDIDMMCSIWGVTTDSTGTASGLWDTVDSLDLLPATDTPPPYSGNSEASFLPCSPADQALTRLSHPISSELMNQRDSPPIEEYDLSPSLVALEMDSEEDSPDPQSSISTKSPDSDKNEEKMENFGSSLDLTCTRSQSTSSACDPTLKELGDPGIRLRSYSYSTPKISFRPRFSRENATPDISTEQRATSVSEHSYEKRIEEEELDKYNIPTKVESDKYKVIRTFSFLKSRMSSTRNKTKGKGKDRETKDRETKDRQVNGHRFSTGSCLGSTVCGVCDKPASGKDLLHCSCCTVIIHKSCKESAPPCLKKLHDKYSITAVKNRTASLPQNFTVRDSSAPSVVSITTALPPTTLKEKMETMTSTCPNSGSPLPNSDSGASESPEAETDAWRVMSQSEEILPSPVCSTSTDSSFAEDCVDAIIHSDIMADAVDYEAESWSLTVEHKFCKKQDKRAVKRQDVIYELMLTELHHLQTLHIMAEIFRRGMREEVQLDAETVERVFPCLDQLLLFHHNYFSAMRERRHGSAQPQGHRNYLIQQIGDILLQQFSGENGEKMKQIYGDFCSRHNEAVSFFKDLQQHNKRFQSFIKQQGNNSMVRRREIPECILLVTQRITKYPVLLERILQYTQVDTEEHKDLSKALAHIREVITAVDLKVSEYERHQRLQELWNRMENRSAAKLKNGHIFRKQDMMRPGQILNHQGVLLWKTATGRLKDVMALLLTDTLIFLQEKDQKYTFAAVDQKPPVIMLQKLIVREVANEERGMFLISASTAGPEMYEVHTSSKDERNMWMRLIRDAVESCPEEEEEYTSESEEERRAADARVQKIHKLQESLMSQDQQICSSLEEKLQIYTELAALSGRMEAQPLEPQLLVQPHVQEPPQATALLAAALQEVENLKATLSSLSPDSDTDSVSSVSPLTPLQTPSDSDNSPVDPEANEESWSGPFILSPLPHLQTPDTNDINCKVTQSVQSLTRLLYSLQAAVTIQDSCYEVQRILLQETERLSPRAQRPHPSSIRGNTLQEQEKQRNLEKQKEELAEAQRLQDQLRLEKERWEKECHTRRNQQGEQESKLEERERQCHLEAERLRREREELEEQLEEYQQNLERLRESQRSVERERERLATQQKLLQSWRHSRQRSLPSVIPRMFIHLDPQQGSPTSQSRVLATNGSVYLNEATFAGPSINNCHHKGNDPSTHNCLNTLLMRSNSRQSSSPKTPHPHVDSERWAAGTGYLNTPAGRMKQEHTGSDLNTHNYIREVWSSTATAAHSYPVHTNPCGPQLDLDMLVSLETESSGEQGSEETIVYI